MSIEQYVIFCCDRCCKEVSFSTDSKMRGIDYARNSGWAVARDRIKCYCPKCADGARSAGGYSRRV
jgi:hypothetical protein